MHIHTTATLMGHWGRTECLWFAENAHFRPAPRKIAIRLKKKPYIPRDLLRKHVPKSWKKKKKKGYKWLFAHCLLKQSQIIESTHQRGRGRGRREYKGVQNTLESDHTRSFALLSVIWVTRQPAKGGTGNLEALWWTWGGEKREQESFSHCES